MDERDKRRVGEQIEPGGRPKAPGRLELLQRFINTHNHEFPEDWDRIGTPEKARAWLGEKELIGPDDAIAEAGVARLRTLREGLRALAIANQAGLSAAAASDAIRDVSDPAALSVVVDAGGGSAPAPPPPGGGRGAGNRLATPPQGQPTRGGAGPEGGSSGW